MKKILLNPIAYVYLGLNCLIALGMSFFFVTYVPFLEEKGMNLLEINIINAFFMIFVVLSEMPTGSFADNFGRNRSLSLACLLLSSGFFLYFFSSSFLIFILAEIILAFGHTFYSGALEAWMVDSLGARGEEELTTKIFVYEPTFKSIGLVTGVLIGSYLGEFDLSLPWIVSALLMFIIFILSLFIKENYKVEEDGLKEKNNLIKEVKTAWNYGVMNKDLLFVMIFGACLTFSIQALNMQWPLVFKNEHGFSSFQLGWLFVGMAISISVGAHLSYKIRRVLSEKQAIIIPQIITAIAIIICSYVSLTSAIITFFLLHELGRGVIKPLQQDFINRRLQSKNRATLLSLNSIFIRAGALLGLIFSGIVANMSSISIAWLLSGSILLLVVIFFSLYFKKKALKTATNVV